MDETRVVTPDRGNGGFLTGNRTQEVVGSIPISSTNTKRRPDCKLCGRAYVLLAIGDGHKCASSARLVVDHRPTTALHDR